jgi:hypothetical protein
MVAPECEERPWSYLLTSHSICCVSHCIKGNRVEVFASAGMLASFSARFMQ